MVRLITSSEKFADKFNVAVPGACRRITANDVRAMTQCGLIGRYRAYGRTDLETVRGILQYEELREHEQIPRDKEAEPPTCKICRQPLPTNPEGKAGRPKEYCSDCETHRNRERQKKCRLGSSRVFR